MFFKFVSLAILAFVFYLLYKKVILPSLRGESIGISSKKDELIAAVKRKLILEGEGEGAKRQLIMNADGGLDKKLETYKEVSFKYAEAIQNAQPSAWTPTVVMGGNGGNANGGGATALVDMLTAKAAKDIGIDLQASGRDKTSRK